MEKGQAFFLHRLCVASILNRHYSGCSVMPIGEDSKFCKPSLNSRQIYCVHFHRNSFGNIINFTFLPPVMRKIVELTRI